MCRNNDHGGRRCPASANKAKRSAQNRAYYLSRKGVSSPTTIALGISNTSPKLSQWDAVDAKLDKLPSGETLRDFLARKAEVTDVDYASWTKDDGHGGMEWIGTSEELKEEGEKHVNALREAFNNEFTHGDVGYFMEVTEVEMHSASKDIWNNAQPMRTELHGFINGSDGEKIGYWERVVYFPEDGPARANYRYLQIYNEYQGKGLGRDVIKFFDKAMSKWGVESVEIKANMDVGGYAWAKSGYDWDREMGSQSDDGNGGKFDPDEEWEEQQDTLRGNIEFAAETWGDPDGSINAMIGRLKQPYNTETYPTPFEVAALGSDNSHIDPEGKAMWVGKRAMLDSSWYGTRKL